jgi:hypothetical protein
MIRVSLAALLLAACGPEPSSLVPTAVPTGSTGVSSGSPLERYFPLVEGTLFFYDVETLSDHPSNGALSARVNRLSATSGMFKIGATTQKITYEPDGVVATDQGGERTYLLKAPLEKGTKWLGEHGGAVEIVDADAVVSVTAGSFTGCVVTHETRGGDVPKDVTTTYCPDVGIVELSLKSAAMVQRASLRQFGPPVDLGPEGVTHTVSPE